MDEIAILTHLSALPDLRQVYYRMGFKSNRVEIPLSIQSLVEEAIFKGRKLLEAKACCVYCPITRPGAKTIVVSDLFTIYSSKVFDWLEACQGIYLAAVTIGPQLDAEVSRLTKANDVTRAFLLNAYGAEAAEALMEELDREIAERVAGEGLSTVKRYSPGYGDWLITAQRELLEAVQARRIGIQLTEKFLMIPEKSVSAIIGVKGK